MEQSTTWQRRILNLAKTDDYAGLYWVVLIKWPLGEVDGKTSMERQKKRYRYPTIGGLIPAIEVAPDPDMSKAMAQLLAGILVSREGFNQLYQPRLILTTPDALNKTPWFIWGDQDLICPYCAQIINLQKCTCKTDNGGIIATN